MYQEADRVSIQSRSDVGSAYKDQLRAQLRDNYVSNRAERKSHMSYQSQASRDSASNYPVDYQPQLRNVNKDRFGVPAQQKIKLRDDSYKPEVYTPGSHYNEMMQKGTRTPSDVRAYESIFG
jgi:hypothetical protein